MAHNAVHALLVAAGSAARRKKLGGTEVKHRKHALAHGPKLVATVGALGERVAASGVSGVHGALDSLLRVVTLVLVYLLAKLV
jgi:hypothetical protein